MLNAAVDAHIISAEQADQLCRFMAEQEGSEARFDFTHVLYYLGGMLAIGAMTVFLNLGCEASWGLGHVLYRAGLRRGSAGLLDLDCVSLVLAAEVQRAGRIKTGSGIGLGFRADLHADLSRKCSQEPMFPLGVGRVKRQPFSRPLTTLMTRFFAGAPTILRFRQEYSCRTPSSAARALRRLDPEGLETFVPAGFQQRIVGGLPPLEERGPQFGDAVPIPDTAESCDRVARIRKACHREHVQDVREGRYRKRPIEP